jgi:hypothetical protein
MKVVGPISLTEPVPQPSLVGGPDELVLLAGTTKERV